MFNKLGYYVGVASFFIGALILIFYIVTQNENFMIYGYFYLFAATGVNLLTVLYLLVDSVINKPKLKKNFITIVFMLLNIPIAFICAFIGLSIKF